jgi:hypothetical protein
MARWRTGRAADLPRDAGAHFKTHHLMRLNSTPANSQAVHKAAFENDVGDIDETLEAARDDSVPYAIWMQTLA